MDVCEYSAVRQLGNYEYMMLDSRASSPRKRRAPCTTNEFASGLSMFIRNRKERYEQWSLVTGERQKDTLSLGIAIFDRGRKMRSRGKMRGRKKEAGRWKQGERRTNQALRDEEEGGCRRGCKEEKDEDGG